MPKPPSGPQWPAIQPEPAKTLADPLRTGKEFAAMLGVGLSTLYRYKAKGLVPPPIKLGGTSRWPQSEILGVIEAAKAARDCGAKAASNAK